MLVSQWVWCVCISDVVGGTSDRREDIHSAVSSDMASIFKGKTVSYT